MWVVMTWESVSVLVLLCFLSAVLAATSWFEQELLASLTVVALEPSPITNPAQVTPVVLTAAVFAMCDIAEPLSARRPIGSDY